MTRDGDSELGIFLSGPADRDKDMRELKRSLENAESGICGQSFSRINAFWFGVANPPRPKVQDTFRTLRDCDALVLLLTDTALDSRLVREEVVFAHYLGLSIFALSPKHEAERKSLADQVQKAFSFSKYITFLEWDGTDLAEGLRRLLREFQHSFSADNYALAMSLLRNGRKLGFLNRSLEGLLSGLASEPRYRLRLARSVLSQAADEVDQVLGGSYSLNIGLEQNFLRRAGEIFNSAERVFAISRDNVSRFWVDDNSRPIALQYLKAQIPETTRLFVFSDPRRAHYYAEVLDAHAKRYGDTGSVLITSEAGFAALMEHLGVVRGDNPYDFGLLEMMKPDGESRVLHAELGPETLRFAYLQVGEQPAKNELMKVLAEIKTMTQEGYQSVREAVLRKNCPASFSGLFAESIDVEGGHYIMRWVEGAWKACPEQWIGSLKQLFGLQREIDVQHLLLIPDLGADSPSIGQTLGEVREEIGNAFREAGGRSRVWLGKRHIGPPIIDREYGGKVNVESDRGKFQYALWMSFDGLESMNAWYRHPRHPELRRRVYCGLLPGLTDKYVEMDKMPMSKRAKHFEQWIEPVVSEHLWRLDYAEDYQYEAIVRREPFVFPYVSTGYRVRNSR